MKRLAYEDLVSCNADRRTQEGLYRGRELMIIELLLQPGRCWALLCRDLGQPSQHPCLVGTPVLPFLNKHWSPERLNHWPEVTQLVKAFI